MKKIKSKGLCQIVPWFFVALVGLAVINLLNKQGVDFQGRQSAALNIERVKALSKQQKNLAHHPELDGLSKIYSALGQSRDPGSVKELD